MKGEAVMGSNPIGAIQMSHTKRYYNKPNHIKDFYHPWRQLCCGHCKRCRKWDVSKQRRLAYLLDLRLSIRQENSAIEWQEIIRDPMRFALNIWDDYLDWLERERNPEYDYY